MAIPSMNLPRQKFTFSKIQSSNYGALSTRLIGFAFYLAYYMEVLALFAYGAFGDNDLIAKWKYKKVLFMDSISTRALVLLI